MKRPDNPFANLYEQLNRGHDCMRESLLARLPADSEDFADVDRRESENHQSLTRKRKIRSRWYASPAVGLAGVLLLVTSVWFILSWSPSLTLAQVKSAVVQQKWVLVEYSDGEESWICLLDGRRFFKTTSGRLGLSAPGISQQYYPPNPDDGAFANGRITVYRATPEQMKEIPHWQPISAWDHLVGKAEEAARETKSNSNSRRSTERHEEVIDGRKLVRFDSIYVDALGNKKVRSQLWADPVTRLPVRSRKSKDHTGVDPSDGESFVDGMISFPDTGPADIYSLGAPRDAELVRVYDPEDDPELVDRPADLRRLIANARVSVANFPERFRLVKWHAEATGHSGGEIDILYWNGKPKMTGDQDTRFPDWTGVKIRQERYFNLSQEHPLQHLPLPADVSKLLEWADGQTPVYVSIADGERTYSQNGPYPPAFEYRKPTVQVMRIRGNGVLFDHNSWPTKMYWPFFPSSVGGRRAGHYELIDEPAASTPGTVLLRITRGARRFDYHIAPDRDHICLRQTWWRQREGDWHKDREYVFSDLRQLPSKQWWAARERLQTFDNPELGTSGYVTTFLIDIALAEEFPPAAFDGGKLLEEARKLNAEIIAH